MLATSHAYLVSPLIRTIQLDGETRDREQEKCTCSHVVLQDEQLIDLYGWARCPLPNDVLSYYSHQKYT